MVVADLVRPGQGLSEGDPSCAFVCPPRLAICSAVTTVTELPVSARIVGVRFGEVTCVPPAVAEPCEPTPPSRPSTTVVGASGKLSCTAGEGALPGDGGIGAIGS